MVKLHILFEGGGQANNENTSVAYNTQILRESLHSFFCRLLNRDDISISISMEYGYRNAVQSFLASETKVKLFVDSDMPKDGLENWFTKVETENPNKIFSIADEKKPNIYFMVQEMESWFLKQPQCFEKWAEYNGYKRRRLDKDIQSYISDISTDVEYIKKPSIKVKTLLGYFFEKEISAGHFRHAKYNKLTTASALLDALDVRLLEMQDTELQRFKICLN